MIQALSIYTALQRHQSIIDKALRQAVEQARHNAGTATLDDYYGHMQYHLGWVDATFTPTQSNPGKLLRPTLLLLAYEAAGAWQQTQASPDDTTYLERALPAATSIELTHNFTLIHDDIEDGDTERRHRPTLWSIWGIPQAINSGDGMFGLARLALWESGRRGVDSDLAIKLAEILDRTILTIAEGQYLDISFEHRQDVSASMYIDMIQRKTAVLMGCAAEIGAMLGTSDTITIERLRDFGLAIGIAFQVRDDILGVWATTEKLGKTPAGDIYRRKKSLPILHALENAAPVDKHILQEAYQQTTPLTAEQVADILAIFERTQTHEYCRTFLSEQCNRARIALQNVPRSQQQVSRRAQEDLATFISFVEEAIK